MFHAEWLGRHLPRTELRALEHEGHVSIVRHLEDVLDDLVTSSGQ
jgi:hypothetical protein